MKVIGNSEKGFSLLEVMVAVALVAVALVALLALSNRSIDVNGRLQRVTRATLLAQQVMTRLESEPGIRQMLTIGEENDFEEPFEQFRWNALFEDTPIPGIKAVTVTVLWGRPEKNEAVELTSFLPELGP